MSNTFWNLIFIAAVVALLGVAFVANPFSAFVLPLYVLVLIPIFIFIHKKRSAPIPAYANNPVVVRVGVTIGIILTLFVVGLAIYQFIL